MALHCELCKTSFTLRQNLNRHVKKRCKIQNPESVNHNIPAVNHNISAVNHNISAVNHNISAVNHNTSLVPIGFKVSDDKFQCEQCLRIMFRKNINNHRKVCKGCPSNTCRVCGKVFRFQSAVSRHEKRCTESTTPASASSSTSVSASHRQERIHHHHHQGTTIINNHNVTNNNNNTIVNIHLNVYGQENYDVLCNMLRTKYPQAFRNVVEDGDVATLLRLVHFNTDFPENQTIRKPVKKDISTEVHVGDGRWEKRPTKHVLDTFCESTTKRVFRNLVPNCITKPVTNYTYLTEVMYQQSKRLTNQGDATTDGLLSPFQLSEQEQDEKELRAYIAQMKESLTNEYPTIVHTPIFAKTFKQSIRDRIKTYESKWGVSVVV
jgi:hypothetical protein